MLLVDDDGIDCADDARARAPLLLADAMMAAMLPRALDHYQYQLKGVSFLPRVAAGAYAQMPYEAIDEREYARRAHALRPLDFDAVLDGRAGPALADTQVPDKFCDTCTSEAT